MITLSEAHEGMSGLVRPSGRPNGKLALWIALASIRTHLSSTARKAGVLRRYLHSPLPEPSELKRLLGGFTFESTLGAYYTVQRLWDQGEINLDIDSTFQAQADWRERMVSAVPGVGYKTASWAMQLYSPATCKILTLDIHHLRRMTGGLLQSARNPLVYELFEQQLIEDSDALVEGTGYWRISGAAWLWAVERNRYAKVFPDHTGLTTYE